MLELISSYSSMVIVVGATLHVGLFGVLSRWARRDRRRIAQTLERFTDGLPHRSRMDWDVPLSDQIEAFLADIHDVLHEPADSDNRRQLHQRLNILDERREYLQSLRFETVWNVAASMIEAYPLAGVLGTILAIGAALAADVDASVAVIVTRFGDAIWSTFAGLSAAIVLMFLHSFVEPGFARLTENRSQVRAMAGLAKRELASTDAGGAAASQTGADE
ncbi:MAG: MotA/TolQ/ExbB proton channel family protein [Planctomycetota bacterium]